MHVFKLSLFGVAVFTLATVTPAFGQLRATLYASGFSAPVGFVQHPLDASVQFVIEKGGRVRVVRNGVVQPTDFLNLVGQVTTGAEQGLLGFAFAPDYATTGRVFVSFTNLEGDSVISRYNRSAGNPMQADVASRFDLLWPDNQRVIAQPFANHNGGNIMVGPDGYLYFGLGDGGSGNDPFHNAQNPLSLLGKMLRIDVSVPDSDFEGYDVPASNPFVGQAGVLPEIWSLGLRNPWQWSFDDPRHGGTGALVIGDVGQDNWEEIDYEPAGAGGRNYGWRNREGAHDNVTSQPPYTLPLRDPIWEYSHADGKSVTGGFVYRGTALGTSYVGRYFFADFIKSRVWSFRPIVDPVTHEAAASSIVEHTAELGSGASSPSTFGVDARGELYVVNYGGTIYRIDSIAGSAAPSVVVDFNGDAQSDVFTYTSQSGLWAARSSAGDGTFDAATGAWAPGWSVTPARFNSDAFGDFFLINPTSGQWFKMLGDGAGGFTSQANGFWSLGWKRYVVNLDNDGISDVFLWNSSGGVWFKCLSTPGGFSCSQGSWTSGWEVYPLHFNGDALDDFFLFDRNSGLWFWVLGNAGAGFTYPQFGFWSTPWRLFPGDFTGDGLSDILLLEPATGLWFVAATDAGGFSYTTGIWAPGWSPVVLDLDADNRADLLLHNPTTGQWFELVSSGTGTFSVGGSSFWSLNWNLYVADFNADGRDDILLYDPTRGLWFQARNLTLGSLSYTSGFWPLGATVVTGTPTP